jgi:trehalose 6-phosphate synthase/phosphatase
MNSRLVVVSNRLPLTLRKTNEGHWATQENSGGLVSALGALLRKTSGVWIGWPGDTGNECDQRRRAILREWAETNCHFAVDLPAHVAAGFYEGYSNQALWPVFHYFPSQLRFDPKNWEAYVEANRIFCKAIVNQYQPEDRIWIHDYHLLLLPQMLREELPDAAIGFFLHIPFPGAEMFSVLPRCTELLQGLLGADLLAFQTHGHLQQFRSSLLKVLGVEGRISEVPFRGRTICMEALPIGTATEEYAGLLAGDPAALRHYSHWAARYAGQKIILAVDRLDYTKGIPERLRTYQRLLESEPELKERVVLVQIAVPTREGIGDYQSLRAEVNGLVGKVNGAFGTLDWTPVLYVNRAIDREELVALYGLADICWVGSLRDGMNLVSKEYVACHADGRGVLILSEFAGAAAELREALLINPFDEQRTAAVVARALNMEERERRARMSALHGRVTVNSVFHWGDRFLAALEEAVSARRHPVRTETKRLSLTEIQRAYIRARSHMLVLDYDGTLIPFVDHPQQAVPPGAVLSILASLASNPNNCVAIASGRRARDLDQWFGMIQGLWLIAEHGAEVRPPGSPSWECLMPSIGKDWKCRVQPILECFVDRAPGSLIEEKEHSLVWHYRLVEPELAAMLANELVPKLEAVLIDPGFGVFRGAKIVEVRPALANKGRALEYLHRNLPRPDFTLAVGDDRTDEDLFERTRDGWTVHVGTGDTCAEFVVPDVESVRRILGAFVEAERLGAGNQPQVYPRGAPRDDFDEGSRHSSAAASDADR